MAVEYLTLDGVFEDPAWTQPYFDEAVGAFQGEAMQWADALLMGRVTYDGMSQAWPAAGNDPATGGDIMNSIRKYVADLDSHRTDLERDVPHRRRRRGGRRAQGGRREPPHLRQRATRRRLSAPMVSSMATAC